MDLLSRLETMLSDYASLFKHNNFHTFVTGRKNCDKQWHGQNKTAFVVAQFTRLFIVGRGLCSLPFV